MLKAAFMHLVREVSRVMVAVFVMTVMLVAMLTKVPRRLPARPLGPLRRHALQLFKAATAAAAMKMNMMVIPW